MVTALQLIHEALPPSIEQIGAGGTNPLGNQGAGQMLRIGQARGVILK